MLNSCDMANSNPRVLVTESEYRKAEACFLSAPELECLRAPDAEADLASAICEARAPYVVVGPRTYSGALYEALPLAAVASKNDPKRIAVQMGRGVDERLQPVLVPEASCV